MSGRIQPTVPEFCPEYFAPILKSCFEFDPKNRPSAEELLSKFEI